MAELTLARSANITGRNPGCVRQEQENVTLSQEEDAYPFDPEDGCGWENSPCSVSAVNTKKIFGWTSGLCVSTISSVPMELVMPVAKNLLQPSGAGWC